WGVSDAVPVPRAAQCDRLATQLRLGRRMAPGGLAPGGRKLPARPDGGTATGPDWAGRTPAVNAAPGLATREPQCRPRLPLATADRASRPRSAWSRCQGGSGLPCWYGRGVT